MKSEIEIIEERRKAKRDKFRKRFLLLSIIVFSVVIGYHGLNYLNGVFQYDVYEIIYERVEVIQSWKDRDMWYDGYAFHYDDEYYFLTNSTRLTWELESDYLFPIGTLLLLEFEVRYYYNVDVWETVFTGYY